MTERSRYWSELVGAWGRSGLSQAEFCRRRGINVGSFAWWKRQLGKASQDLSKRRGRPAKSGQRFVEVHLRGGLAASAYEVVLAGGRSIRVPSEFDPHILSRLIAVVESC